MSARAAASSSWRRPVAYQGMWTTPAILCPHLGADGAGAVDGASLALLRRADEDGDLPEVLVRVHELVGLRDLVEGHGTPEHRPDEALLDERVGLVALPRVGEVRAEDLLLAHPQVAHVEVEVVARRGAADDDLAERLDGQHRRREGRLADVLEDDVGRVAEDVLHALGELARDREARLLLLGRLAAAAHHA